MYIGDKIFDRTSIQGLQQSVEDFRETVVNLTYKAAKDSDLGDIGPFKICDLPPGVNNLAIDLVTRLRSRARGFQVHDVTAPASVAMSKIVLDLVCLVCMMDEMVNFNGRWRAPNRADLDNHIIACHEIRCCSCRAVMELMDHDGKVLEQFPANDRLIAPLHIQDMALGAVAKQIKILTRALKAIDKRARKYEKYDRGASCLERARACIRRRLHRLVGRAQDASHRLAKMVQCRRDDDETVWWQRPRPVKENKYMPTLEQPCLSGELVNSIIRNGGVRPAR